MISPDDTNDDRGGSGSEPLGNHAVDGFQSSELYQLWRNRVLLDDNDLIIAVAASTRTEISGTGKSTLALTLARHFDNTDAGYSAEQKATLSATEVADRLYPGLPEQSAIIFDEAQGTVSNDGVDARRAMKTSVVKMARAAMQYRNRQQTLIIVAQTTDWLDTRMMDVIDRLVLIQQKDPEAEVGHAITFDHYRNDLPSNTSSSVFTPAVEDLYWEPLPGGDGDYEALNRMKEQAGAHRDGDDEGDAVPPDLSEMDPDRRDPLLNSLAAEGISQKKLAAAAGVSEARISQILVDGGQSATAD